MTKSSRRKLISKTDDNASCEQLLQLMQPKYHLT
jgi:hypothetical protein